MIRSAVIFFIMLLIPLALVAAGQAAATPEPAGSVKSEATDLVVLRISGRPITEQQVLNMIDDMAKQMSLPFEKLRQRNSLLFKDALNNLTTLALLKDQISQQNLEVDAAAVEQQASKIAKQYPSQEAFLKALSSQGITESELKKNLKESIGLQMVIDNAVKNVAPVADADIEKFYKDNPDKFALPERVHAKHILLRVPSNATEGQKTAIEKKLEGILADIEAKNITFEEAAAKYSQDSSTASKGGDLGTFSRGNMVKSFEDAAFGTKPGMLSLIVESPYGYHLIKVLDQKPAGQAAVEESKAAIRQYLEQSAKQAAKQKYVEELQSKANIESFMTQEEFLNRHSTD
jgi:peptidyl-prolyl cis-trans isomerase C